jgi:hypothetical protein
LKGCSGALQTVLKAVLRTAWRLAAGLGLALALVTPAPAQYSPNCERNGRREFCAYTPGSDAGAEGLSSGWLVFADHRVYEVQRDERSCRDQGPLRLCKGWILTPPGSPKPLAATYRGTSYEGGYRHEFIGTGLRLTFTFLD